MVLCNEFYEILGVDSNASEKEIKKAYHKKSLVEHPDKGGNEEKFKKINEAYEILKDNEKRQIYDKYGKNGLSNELKTSDNMFGNFFNNMFNNSFDNNIFNMFNKNNVVKVTPILYNCNVTLEQICRRKVIKIKYNTTVLCDCYIEIKCTGCNGIGIKKQIIQLGPNVIQQVNSQCNLCLGNGNVIKTENICLKCTNGKIQKENVVNLHLTPDMKNGYEYRFNKKGNQISRTIENGDFVVIINYVKHDLFDIDNKNIILKLKVSLKDALIGYNTNVIHPNGENIKIDTKGYVIEPDFIYKIDKKGITEEGYFILKFEVIFPKNLSEIQKKKLSEILE